MDEKLSLKKQKYLDEKYIHKWDNIELSNTFSDDQITKVLTADKGTCMKFILPKDQREIQESMVISAYLTESLLSEIQRVKSSISYYDVVGELKLFNHQSKLNF
jgi:hypothetical protein